MAALTSTTYHHHRPHGLGLATGLVLCLERQNKKFTYVRLTGDALICSARTKGYGWCAFPRRDVNGDERTGPVAVAVAVAVAAPGT